MAVTREVLQGKSIMPSLSVNNLQESIRFFEALGFEVGEKWEHEGTLLGVMLKGGACQLGISQDDGKKGRDRVKGVGMRLYVEADGNIDQIAAQAKAAGVHLTREPHDTDWGSRAFEVTEPTGFLITIGSPDRR